MLPRRFSTEIWIRNSGDESLLPHGVEETKRATTGGRPYGVGTSCAPFCPSFSAKSHVCECLVFINAHIYAFAALPTFHGGSRTQKRREKIKTGSGTQNGRPLGVALRRRDKLRSVPIFGMKISHTLRCPSFSAKSHVCECLVFINAHITPSRHYQLFTVFMESEQA